MGRPQVPDWAPQFRWSAGLSHPRWLACWSPRELRAAGAGRGRRPAFRGGADASKAPGATARRRGYCNRCVARRCSFTPLSPGMHCGPSAPGRGRGTVVSSALRLPPPSYRPGRRGASLPGSGQRPGPERPGRPPASLRRARSRTRGSGHPLPGRQDLSDSQGVSPHCGSPGSPAVTIRSGHLSSSS